MRTTRNNKILINYSKRLTAINERKTHIFRRPMVIYFIYSRTSV